MEARYPLRTKFQPRSTADSLRKYLRWAIKEEKIRSEQADTVRLVLDQYEAVISMELDHLEERLQSLRHRPGIEVFALTEDMLARTIELSTMNLDLKPFDQAILAAVLVKAEQLRNMGAEDLSFCELDSDLQPWDKRGNVKQPLKSLYDSARLWVYEDFLMESPRQNSGASD
jgi:sulfur transfer complex TusBCD TusB component (DsrH family)